MKVALQCKHNNLNLNACSRFQGKSLSPNVFVGTVPQKTAHNRLHHRLMV